MNEAEKLQTPRSCAMVFFLVFVVSVFLGILIFGDRFGKYLFGLGLDQNYRDDAKDGVPEAIKILTIILGEGFALNLAVVNLPEFKGTIQIVYAVLGVVTLGAFSGILNATKYAEKTLHKYDAHSIFFTRWCFGLSAFLIVGAIYAAEKNKLPGQTEPPIILPTKVEDHTFKKGKYEGVPGLKIEIEISPETLNGPVPKVLNLEFAIPPHITNSTKFGTPKLYLREKIQERKYWPSRPTQIQKEFRDKPVFSTLIPGLQDGEKYTVVFTLLPTNKKEVPVKELKAILSTEGVFDVVYYRPE